MRPDRFNDPGDQQAPAPLLVIVPRDASEAYERLRHELDSDGVQVVLDRRATDRRAHLGAHEPDRRLGDRRTRADRDAMLAGGRWITVVRDGTALDVLDADGRAILFLCCSPHSVPCERCQETYRVGWLSRTDRRLPCPRCGDDLTPAVVAHALRCPYWTHRIPRLSKPPTKVGGGVSPVERAIAG